MNNNFFSLMEENTFSIESYKKNQDSNSKLSSGQNSCKTNLSLQNDYNYGCQTIILNVTKNKKYAASLPLISKNSKNKLNISQMNDYTQNIILDSINESKKENQFNNNENKNDNNKNREIQHILLKSLKKNKEQNINYIKGDNNNYNNIVYNTNNNIIRVIISNEKIMKNFPIEYLNEMICDICNNLYDIKYTSEKVLLTQINGFNNYQTFIERRKSLFNLILRLSISTPISESSLLLTYDIFDRYSSVKPLNNDESLLVIITSFAMAIKYSESSIPNLDELCSICENKFNKEHINKCELTIIEKLNYNISIPTIYDLFQFIKFLKYMTSKEYYLGLFIMEMFVIGGGILKYNPLIVVEAIYSLVLETCGKEKRYINLYKFVSNSNINIIKYNEEINNCLLNLREECLHIKDKNFFYLIKKFSNEKHEKISIDFQLL